MLIFAFAGLRLATASVTITRNLAKEATDPVQKLFLQMIREYKQKSSGGQLVEPTPEITKELKKDMDKLLRQYGGAPGDDMTNFPKFDFQEPELDPIDEITKTETKEGKQKGKK